ncbi:hypothetical protein [Bradyrhizobium elkanii]|uniref:hypothetical protein n=1 Tax=Bradyrhizobium elkanii TaxID=29448 RepID=UPI0035136DD5
MKLHALCASAVALTLALASPAKAEIDQTNRAFILLTTGTFIETTMCDDYEVIPGSVQKMADQNGANFDGYRTAVVAAMQAQIGMEYDRADLIPEVTQLVRTMFNEMAADFDRNKKKACAKWADILLPAGMIRRKK